MSRTWHLFGNDGRRYRTLDHSPDLDPDVASRLERFSWGQARSADYLGTLDREPALWVEPLGDGRHAVTRVLQGEKDAAGRWSQTFLTLVVSSDEWAHSISTSLTRFCGDARTWRVTDRIAVAGARGVAPPEPGSRVLDPDRLSALVRQALDGGAPVVVAPGLLTLADCEETFRRLPAETRRRCGFAFRAVSDALGVTLTALDPRFTTRPSPLGRAVLHRDGRVDREPATPAPLPYPGPSARRAIDLGAGPPRPVAAAAGLPSTFVVADTDPSPPSDRRTLTMTRPVAIAFTLLMLMIVVSGAATFSRVASATGAVIRTADPFDEPSAPPAETKDDLLVRIRDVIDGATQRLASRQDGLEANLRDVESRLSELSDRLDRMTERAVEQSAGIEELAGRSEEQVNRQAEADDRAARLAEGLAESLNGLTATTKEHGERIARLDSTLSKLVDDFAEARKDMIPNARIGQRMVQVEEKATQFERLLKDHVEKIEKLVAKHIAELEKNR